jgi:hypothetical protein
MHITVTQSLNQNRGALADFLAKKAKVNKKSLFNDGFS